MEIKVKTNALKEKNGATVAICNVTFGDQIKIRNITVKEGKNGKFVDMPSYATNKVDENGQTVYQDVFNPITKEGREKLYDAVFESLESGKEIKIPDAAKKEGEDLSIRVVPLENGRNGVIGIGRMYLNQDYVVNNITVRENAKKEVFVSYPSYKTNEVDEQGKAIYKDFAYPSTKEAREAISKMVMDAYKEAKDIAITPKEVDEKAANKEKAEVLKDEKPKGVKAKLVEGAKKSKEENKPKVSAPKKSKEHSME